IGFVVPHEDPDVVDQACDIAVQPDQIVRGTTIIENAQQMGAKNFVHYSFPRHMSQLLMSRRRDIMKQECHKRGMSYYFVTAPDLRMPAATAGDMAFINAENQRAIAAQGMSGHFVTWEQPVDMVTIRAFTDLLVDAADHKADFHDSTTVLSYLEREAGGQVRMRKLAPGSHQWLGVQNHATYSRPRAARPPRD